MKLMEIINVELSDIKHKKVIINLCKNISISDSAEMAVYWFHAGWEINIHIEWSAQFEPNRGKSRIGRDLIQSLSNYGLVTHILWTEEK